MTSIITRLHHITGYGTAARVPDDSRVSVEAKVINEAAEVIGQMLAALQRSLRLLQKERASIFDGYVILYTKDPNVGSLSPEGRREILPWDKAIADVNAAIAKVGVETS